MNLPDGIKHALQMGANEVFYEWLDLQADDPEGALASLGASYQEVVTPEMLTEEQAERYVADLAAWDDGSIDPSHAARVERFVRLHCDAGIELARALIALATDTGDVPARVRSYEPALAPLVALLRTAIADGGFEEHDLAALIWD